MRGAQLFLASVIIIVVTFRPVTSHAEGDDWCTASMPLTLAAVDSVWQGTATSSRFKPAGGKPASRRRSP